MTLKDYLENNIGISIGGTYLNPYATIYPSKPRRCFRCYKNFQGNEKFEYCVLYDYKNDFCRADFSCVNGIPQEKCYKFISKTKSIYLDEAICDSLTTKIAELKSKKY